MKPTRRIIKGAVRIVLYGAALVTLALIIILVAAHLDSAPGSNAKTDSQSTVSLYDNSGTDPASGLEVSHIPGNSTDDSFGTNPDDPSITEPGFSASIETDDNNNTTQPTTDIDSGLHPSLPDTTPSVGLAGQREGIQLAIDSVAEKYGAVGVQVAVVRNGRIVGAFAYGDATKGTRPMTVDVKIRVASLSKVVLGMLVMRLGEVGYLGIDADIGDYWGATVRNPNHVSTPVTIRQMLSHTSSIKVYDYGFFADGETIRRRFLDGSCFGTSTPGAIDSWNYNNYAFAALGLTIEVATDETVNDLAARYLFDPLGIDAAFGPGGVSGTDMLATLYTNSGGVGRSVDEQKRTLGSTYPGERGEEFPGGLTISAYDLAKLVAVLANDGVYSGISVLTPESVSLMETSQGRSGGFDQCLPLWRRTNLYGEEELFYHTGSNFGVYSLMSYNPVRGVGVVVLTTGADGKRDADGIYAICGEISEHIYAALGV